MLRSTLTLLILGMSLGCQSVRVIDDATESGEGEVSGGASGDSGPGVTVTSAGDEVSTTGGDAEGYTDEDESEVDGGGFVQETDTGDDGIQQCDINAEFNECPEGQKCTPYVSEPGSSWWDSTGCFDIAEDPVPLYGECTWNEGSYQGGDNCEEYAYCRATGREGVGQCIGVCRAPWSGNPESSVCEDLATTPYVGCQSCFCECMPNCDPLIQDCPEGQSCLLNFNEGFMCEIDASGEAGQIGDTCLYSNACDPGNVCVAREGLPPELCDDQNSGCCSTFCDLADDACEQLIPGTLCQPAIEEPAEGFEHIGICLLPA